MSIEDYQRDWGYNETFVFSRFLVSELPSEPLYLTNGFLSHVQYNPARYTLSPGFLGAQPKCYIIIHDGRETPAFAAKGIVAVKNPLNNKSLVILSLQPFAHLEAFDPFDMVFDDVLKFLDCIERGDILRPVDFAVCAQHMADHKAFLVGEEEEQVEQQARHAAAVHAMVLAPPPIAPLGRAVGVGGPPPLPRLVPYDNDNTYRSFFSNWERLGGVHRYDPVSMSEVCVKVQVFELIEFLKRERI
jgi:hypothetical protein